LSLQKGFQFGFLKRQSQGAHSIAHVTVLTVVSSDHFSFIRLINNSAIVAGCNRRL
jgi:hypothetical protein